MGMAGVRQNYDNILAKQANGTYSTYGPIVLTHEIDGVTMDISQDYLPQMNKQSYQLEFANPFSSTSHESSMSILISFPPSESLSKYPQLQLHYLRSSASER